jgi:shikimate kinase
MSALVLVGPMGVGKTTIGKKLAKAMDRSFVDSDAVIVSLHGAIPEIFESKGEAHFRSLEEDVVIQHLPENIVLATGGGAVLSERTRAALASAFVVYLSTDGRHMASRLQGGDRPLLKNGLNDWRRIYESRKHLYEQVADITIDTSAKPLAQIILEIKTGYAKYE